LAAQGEPPITTITGEPSHVAAGLTVSELEFRMNISFYPNLANIQSNLVVSGYLAI
jgi:hypothetical protein